MSPKTPAESSELDQRWRDALAHGLVDRDHGCPAGASVRGAVGGHHPLIDAPGGFDLDVVVAGDQDHETFPLPIGDQGFTGVQGPPRPVQRIVLEAVELSRTTWNGSITATASGSSSAAAVLNAVKHMPDQVGT